MPTIPCERVISCPGSDFPIQNWTSEQPDKLFFIGHNWGWDRNYPCLGCNWTHSSCLGTCTSTISQEDADLCAAANELLCLTDCNSGDPACGDGGGGNGGPANNVSPNSFMFPVYYNRAQTCEAVCDDGTLFSYTLPAGSINATSQIEADRIAYSIACRRADTRKVCIESPLGTDFKGCVDETLLGNVFFAMIGPGSPFVITVASGSLPPGVSFIQISDRTAVLFGSFTTAGNYSFTVQAVSNTGSTHQQIYTASVLGITNPNLPDGTVGSAYSQQLLTDGGTAPITFNLIGTLPTGLTLDSATGIISGTPTTAGVEGFEVEIIDSEGSSCKQVVSITVVVTPVTCGVSDFSTISWGAPTIITTPPATAVMSAVGDTVTGKVTSGPTGMGGFGDGVAQVLGSMVYTSPIACSCALQLDVTGTDNSLSFIYVGNVLGFGDILSVAGAALIDGTYPFTLAAGVAKTVYFYVRLQVQSIDVDPGKSFEVNSAKFVVL